MLKNCKVNINFQGGGSPAASLLELLDSMIVIGHRGKIP